MVYKLTTWKLCKFSSWYLWLIIIFSSIFSRYSSISYLFGKSWMTANQMMISEVLLMWVLCTECWGHKAWPFLLGMFNFTTGTKGIGYYLNLWHIIRVVLWIRELVRMLWRIRHLNTTSLLSVIKDNDFRRLWNW